MACSRLLMTPGLAKGGQSERKEEIAILCMVTSDQPDKSQLVRSYSRVGSSRAACKAKSLGLLGGVLYLGKKSRKRSFLREIGCRS